MENQFIYTKRLVLKVIFGGRCSSMDPRPKGVQTAVSKIAAKQCLRLLMMLDFDAYLCLGVCVFRGGVDFA